MVFGEPKCAAGRFAFVVKSVFAHACFAVALLSLGCGQDPSFFDTKNIRKEGADKIDSLDGVRNDQEQEPEQEHEQDLDRIADVDHLRGESNENENKADDDASYSQADKKSNASKGYNHLREIVVETFHLPSSFEVNQSVDNSSEPLRTQTFEQNLGAPRTFRYTVLNQSQHERSFLKNAPIRNDTEHAIGWADKKLDIFVTIDDSESFIAIDRARAAIHALVGDLFDANWRLFIGGLEGVGGKYDHGVILKGSKNWTSVQGEINDALAGIFATGSLGDERVFRSLGRLTHDYRSQSRGDATHVYFVITDAPNCKDRNNAESNVCNRIPGQNDHHTYLINNNPNRANHMRHMSLFGAYYRMSDNPSVCGNSDAVEVPLANETFKLQSQYAQLAFQWESLIYPNTSANALPKWVGDICSVQEDLNWLQAFVEDIRNVLSYRFNLSAAPSSFRTEDEHYNLKVQKQNGAILNGSQYRVESARTIVLDDNSAGVYTATYHLHNNYLNVNYTNFFSPPPQNGSVQLSWTGGNADCVEAASFNVVSSHIMCRHTGAHLYLRNADFLPKVEPGEAPVTVKVSYLNAPHEVDNLIVNAASEIYADTVVFKSFPSTAATLIDKATLSLQNQGKRVLLKFAENLPPGVYDIAYYDLAQTAANFNLNDTVAAGEGGVLCFVPNLAVAFGHDQNKKLFVEPAEAEFPCEFHRATNQIALKARVPKVNGKRELQAIFNGFVQPLNTFSLNYPPYQDKVKVGITSEMAAGETILEEFEYDVSGNNVSLVDYLYPGEKLSLNYEFRPPLKECYRLRGKPYSDHSYEVAYGALYEEQELPASAFTISKDDGETSICLNADLLRHGHRLVVRYLALEQKEEI